MRSNVGASRRKFELLAASCLVPLSLGVSEPARAQSCSPVNTPGTLTAAQPSTQCSGTFNTNINFGGVNTPPPSLLTLTLQQGPPPVIVNSPTGGNAVNLQNTSVLDMRGNTNIQVGSVNGTSGTTIKNFNPTTGDTLSLIHI